MTLNRLQKIFAQLSKKKFQGIKGVHVFDSGVRGPTVGITVQTHGNEPVGLAVYPFLEKLLLGSNGLKSGRVFLVLNNIRASRNYLKAASKGDRAGCEKARFVDVNMNRLNKRQLANKDCRLYEIRRAKELMPVWRQFEYGIDIHSTSLKSNPMIIAVKKSNLDLVKKFPFRDILTNIDDVQVGVPACALYGNKSSSIFGLEAGQHNEKESFRRAVLSVEILLSSLDMIDVKQSGVGTKKRIFKIFDAFIPKNNSYKMVKTFRTFQKIKKGELIAEGKGGIYFAKQNCVGLFARDAELALHMNEEAIFFAKEIDG